MVARNTVEKILNHLAHCWLARGCDGHIAGGFLGDFVKGKLSPDLPPKFAEGLRLHRYIDRVSNQLPEMRSTYRRFGTKLRRVAPILLDLIADHLLAVHWARHGSGELTEFSNYCYDVIGDYIESARSREAHRDLVRMNRWTSYRDYSKVVAIMQRILIRLRMSDRIVELNVIEPQIDLMYSDFVTYFPILESLAAEWKANQAELICNSCNQESRIEQC